MPKSVGSTTPLKKPEGMSWEQWNAMTEAQKLQFVPGAPTKSKGTTGTISDVLPGAGDYSGIDLTPPDLSTLKRKTLEEIQAANPGMGKYFAGLVESSTRDIGEEFQGQRGIMAEELAKRGSTMYGGEALRATGQLGIAEEKAKRAATEGIQTKETQYYMGLSDQDWNTQVDNKAREWQGTLAKAGWQAADIQNAVNTLRSNWQADRDADRTLAIKTAEAEAANPGGTSWTDWVPGLLGAAALTTAALLTGQVGLIPAAVSAGWQLGTGVGKMIEGTDWGGAG